MPAGHSGGIRYIGRGCMFDMTKPIDRLYFGKEFNDVMKMPNLIDIQLSSFERFMQREHLADGKPVQKQGIEEVFQYHAKKE